MPLPQVNERIKEMPALALRAVFASIGQVLLVADRFRARAAGQLAGGGAVAGTAPSAGAAPSAAGTPHLTAVPELEPEPAGQRGAGPETAEAYDTRWRSLKRTGNVQLIGHGEEQAGAADADGAAVAGAAATEVSEAPLTSEALVTTEASVTEVAAAEVAATEVPERPGELPVPNYAELSVPSLRARLRMLDAAQVQVLLDYERAHAARPDVITMFERRIVKLTESS